MARRGSSGFRRTGGARRKTSWELGPFGSVGFTAASTSLIPTSSQATLPGLTLIRTRGELNVALSTVTTALDGYSRIGAGIGIVSENAAGVGVSAVPSPLVDINWDGWLWYWTGSIFGVSTTVTNSEGPANVRIPIDSKAMRKWKETDVLVGVFEVDTEVGSAIGTAKLNTRVLVKLP